MNRWVMLALYVIAVFGAYREFCVAWFYWRRLRSRRSSERHSL